MKPKVTSLAAILFVFMALCGCDKVFNIACIGFGGEGLHQVDSSSSSCSTHVLIFCAENVELQSLLESDNADLPTEMVDLYTGENTKAMFLDYNCFTENELVEIAAYDLISDTAIGNIIKISMPTYHYWSTYYTVIAPLLFTVYDDYITMKNPYSGEDILMRGVDYVKFKGLPMLPVPPLEND